jgi:TonB family protein
MKSGFALITLLASVAALAQSPPASPQPVYENKEFGVSFTIPEAWTVADDAARENYAKAAQMRPDQHLLLLLTRANGNGLPERILLVAQEAPKGKYFTTTPQQYLEGWATAHTSLERLTDYKQTWYPSWPSSAIDWFKSKSAPERWYELLATEHRSTFLRIQGEFNSQESLVACERNLTHFEFAPDWKNSNEQIIAGTNMLGSKADQNGAQAPPDKPKMVRVSQGVTQGLLLHKVAPHYPEDARRARLQGTVVLQATVNTRGHIVELRVISGHPRLIDETLKAVSQWLYKPYILNGEPVNFETQVTVNYTLG